MIQIYKNIHRAKRVLLAVSGHLAPPLFKGSSAGSGHVHMIETTPPPWSKLQPIRWLSESSSYIHTCIMPGYSLGPGRSTSSRAKQPGIHVHAILDLEVRLCVSILDKPTHHRRKRQKKKYRTTTQTKVSYRQAEFSQFTKSSTWGTQHGTKRNE